MSLRVIARGVGANVLDKAVILLIQLATVNILAVHWGLERFGTWAMLASVPAILAVADLGMAAAAAARMTMQVARSETDAAKATSHSAWTITTTTGALILLIAVVAIVLMPLAGIPPISEMTRFESGLAIIALAAYGSAVLACMQLQAIFRSRRKYATGILLSTITISVENLLLFCVVLFDGSVAQASSAWLIGRLLGMAMQWTAIARTAPDALPGFRLAKISIMRELAPLALMAAAIPLATALLLQGTVIALGSVAGTLVIPAFIAARTISRIGLQGSQILVTALMPEFAAATAREDNDTVVGMVGAVLASGLLISAPFATILAIFGPDIVSFWTTGAIEVGHPMMIAIAISALCGGLWYPLSNLLLAINRQRSFAHAYLACAMASIGLTLILAERLGGTAGAIALAATDAVMLAIIWRTVWRLWGTSRGIGTGWRRGFATLWEKLRYR